jgi:thymidylate kinase
MNKNLIIINGVPGVGKTTTCEELGKILPKNIYLDCDCFMWANPYIVTDETERIRYENIIFTIKNYLNCSVYNNVIINWVFVNQSAIDKILEGLDLLKVNVFTFSLICKANIWKARMENDKINTKRKIETTFEKWTKRINDGYFKNIKSIIIETSDITAKQVAEIIVEKVNNNIKENYGKIN